MGEELSPEFSSKGMEVDDPEAESHYLVIGPSPEIEDPEKLKQPGEMAASVTYGGDRHFATGILVRDDDGRIAIVVNASSREDSDIERYQDDDLSIRQPKVYTNPELDILYVDDTLKKVKAKSRLPEPVYANTDKPIHESEDFYEYSHLGVRGHDFRLGELVSFGNGIGRLAMIVPEDKPPKFAGTDLFHNLKPPEQQFGIIAERERGKGGPTFLWMVSADEVDYVVHNEKGAIKRYPDNTIFKPTLGNPEFNDPTD